MYVYIYIHQLVPNPTKDIGRYDRCRSLGPIGHPVCVARSLHLTHRGAEKMETKHHGAMFIFLGNHVQVCLEPPSTHMYFCLMCFTSYIKIPSHTFTILWVGIWRVWVVLSNLSMCVVFLFPFRSAFLAQNRPEVVIHSDTACIVRYSLLEVILNGYSGT